MTRNVLHVVLTLSLLSVTTVAMAQPPAHPILDAAGFQQNRDYFSEAPFEHIDTLTGSLVLTFTDLVLPGNAGRDLRFQRTYNSKAGRWTFGIGGLAIFIADPAYPTVDTPEFQELTPALHMSDGSIRKMAWFVAPNINQPSTFNVAISSDFWRYDRPSRSLSMPDGTSCSYEQNPPEHPPAGMLRLTSCTDAFGNTITLEWSTAANPPLLVVRQTLSPTDVREVVWTLDPEFPVSMSFAGRTWTYDPEWVTPPQGAGWQYAYEGLNLVAVTTPHGGVITYTYQNQPYEGPESPQVQYFTNVVSTRSTSGSLPADTWNYTYQIGANGLSGTTTVDTPSRRVRYTHGTNVGEESSVFDGEAGTALLAERVIQQCVATVCTDLEREQRTYTLVPVLDWWTFGTLELDTVTITRYVGAATRQYTTSYEYSAANHGDYHRPITITETGDAGSRVTRRTYEHLAVPFIAGLPATERITVGSESFDKSWTYNSTGFKTSETLYGVRTDFGPDAFGNVATSTKANGKTTSYAYAWGLLQGVATPEHTTTRVINADGTVASETQAGRTTAFAYDLLFRPVTVTPPGASNPIVTDYDPDGAWVRVSRGSSVTTTNLDGFGRPTATVNAVGVRTTMRYDAEGRMVYEGYPYVLGTGSGDIGTALTYDALGRPSRRTHPDGSFSQRVYGLGTIVITDEIGRDTIEMVEAFGVPDESRLVAVVDADAKSWQYSYNALGRLVRVGAPDGTQRTWAYYAGSDLVFRETHPESGATTYAYDAAGVLTQKTDANGSLFSYTLDGNDRVRSIAAAGQTTQIAYELGSDRRRMASVGTVSSEFQYDSAGRLAGRIDVVDGKTFQTAHVYDANDRVIATEYATASGASRRRIGFDYDAEGRTVRVFEGALAYAHTMQYHPSGALLAYSSGNGVLNELTYDASRYWPASVNAAGWRIDYQNYDRVGNVQTIADTSIGGTQTLTYDRVDRLTTAAGAYGATAYTYDVHGNRTTESGSVTYTYDPGTLRLTQQGSTAFSYDANGNVRTQGTKAYTYTPDNMLATATVDGVNVAYRYDADQQRIAQTDPTGSTYFLRGLAGELLTEWRSLGATAQAKDYVYAGSRLVASVSREVTEAQPPACTSVAVIAHDFDTTPLYPTDSPGGPAWSLPNYWETPVFGEPQYGPPLPTYADLLIAERANTVGGKLVSYSPGDPGDIDPVVGAAVFGTDDNSTLFNPWSLNAYGFAEVEVTYRQAYADAHAFYWAPILQVFGKNLHTGIALAAYESTPGQITLNLEWDDDPGRRDVDIATYAFSGLVDQTDRWRIGWVPSTPNPVDGDSNRDGTIRVYRNGTLVHTQSNIAIYVSNAGSAAGYHSDVRGVALGWYGFAGEQDRLRLGYCR